MAKINVEFDTSNKNLTVSMDGKQMPNIVGINIYKYGAYGESDDKNEYDCSVTMLDNYKDEGYKTYTQIIAKESKQGRDRALAGAINFKENKEFVVDSKEILNTAQQCLQKLLNGK
jgi:hypothetical protein